MNMMRQDFQVLATLLRKGFVVDPASVLWRGGERFGVVEGKKKESLIWNQVIYILNLGSTMNLSVKMSKSFLLSFFMCKRSGD